MHAMVRIYGNFEGIQSIKKLGKKASNIQLRRDGFIESSINVGLQCRQWSIACCISPTNSPTSLLNVHLNSSIMHV